MEILQARVADLFESPGGRGLPPRHSRCALVDACCYVVRTGCAWRQLPREFPHWDNVYKTFKAYEPGFVHVDVKYLPQMADEDWRRYLFVAIDRATRWVYVALKADKSARSARAFLKALATACPVRIRRLLTDNGTEFTDRLFGGRARAPTGTHEFDRLCQALGIEHRLARLRHPQTNGMVERFNGRIADPGSSPGQALLRTHHFRSSEDLEQTLHRYVTLYNHHLPQKALNAQTPVQALQHWYASKPELFHQRPHNRPGRDS